MNPRPVPYQVQQHEIQRPVEDDLDNQSVAGSSSSAAFFNEAILHNEDLETYRKAVKKSNDPTVQLDFAKQLITVAEEMRKNPRGLDPKRIKKNREIVHAEAVRWIKKASAGSLLGKPGYAEALFMLADCYGNGTLGLAIDHDKVFFFL
jgi:TPR repeat protein